MKVAIDSGPLTGGDSVRGVGVYTQNLVEHLRSLKGLSIDVVDFRIADFDKYDLVHYPYFKPYFTKLPLIKKSKLIVTIHDLIPLIYPKQYPPGFKGVLTLNIQKMMLKQVDRVITVSETSKKDIVRLLGFPNQKIDVVYEAQRKTFKRMSNGKKLEKVKSKFNLPNKYVLYVGDVNYNKNILGLVDACKEINIPLVIVGKQAKNEKVNLSHIENKSFRLFLKKYRTDKGILRLGFVDDMELVALYNLATVYCQPSFYEGFGLPVLEAFACETPVVISKTQALVEIARKAALVADLHKRHELAKKLRIVLNSNKLQKDLIDSGNKRVRQFSWEKCAKQTYSVYKEVDTS